MKNIIVGKIFVFNNRRTPSFYRLRFIADNDNKFMTPGGGHMIHGMVQQWASMDREHTFWPISRQSPHPAAETCRNYYTSHGSSRIRDEENVSRGP